MAAAWLALSASTATHARHVRAANAGKYRLILPAGATRAASEFSPLPILRLGGRLPATETKSFPPPAAAISRSVRPRHDVSRASAAPPPPALPPSQGQSTVSRPRSLAGRLAWPPGRLAGAKIFHAEFPIPPPPHARFNNPSHALGWASLDLTRVVDFRPTRNACTSRIGPTSVGRFNHGPNSKKPPATRSSQAAVYFQSWVHPTALGLELATTD